ncbi:hypothetical protein BGZ83_011944 [Gryganskiella cystojenkinii]|nr:hypothetical protein BGZ83_011944 [Gryganskiella cystojenkinii]
MAPSAITNPLTRSISRLGLGSYRLAVGVPGHERVVYKALERQSDPRLNINLIDTSTNYSNGQSEQLIGKVLTHPRHNTLTREELVIATKFGYIQNENMRLMAEGVFSRVPPEEIVQYSKECFHSIHPEFMRDQLTRSLERLHTKYVDILFVHNPEYFLMSNVKGSEVNVKKHQAILLQRLSVLFEELEREIESGRIRSYGISSNSFALKPSHAHFLPYQDLVKMATTAFERVKDQKQREHDQFQSATNSSTSNGNTHSPNKNLKPAHGEVGSHLLAKKGSTTVPTARPKTVSRATHGLGFFQMPGNLLEIEGITTTAKWAKSQGLRVFVNRPLNAFSAEVGGPVRLASYPEPHGPNFKEAKAHILEMLKAMGKNRDYLQPKMERLRDMIEGLEESLKSNKLSIMQMEGALVRNQLQQELAKPVKSTKPGQHHHHEKHDKLQEEKKDASSSSTAAAATPSPQTTPAVLKPSVHEIDELVKSLDKFVHVFNQQVRAQESKRVEAMLTERGVHLKGDSIETFAIEYLLDHAEVDSVLLGMKREPYVDFAHKILKDLVTPVDT